MVKGIKDLGNNRYRETFGRYFEDFEIGHIYEHRPGRTITQSDNTWFTLLTMNTHPLHFDEAPFFFLDDPEGCELNLRLLCLLEIASI